MARKELSPFIVLGMHRSYTSLVAGGIDFFAVDMGHALLGASPSNPMGHFENIRFIALNDIILKEAGGSWREPPQESDILEAGRRCERKIKDVLNEESRGGLWGWKDPRTTLTIKCYLPFLRNPKFICCFRDPLEVAESLYKRDRMPIDEGVELAETYNRRLIGFLTEWQKSPL
jgi:hypothetical protein